MSAIRTVTFKSALQWLATRMQGEPERISRENAAAYTQHLNFHVRECWERAFWPEWTVSEERHFRRVWDIGTTYEVGDEVFYEVDGEGAYYRCRIGPVFGELPDDSAFWEQCGVDDAEPLDPYIDLDQTGETPIGTIDYIASANSALHRGAGRLVPLFSSRGVQLPTQTGNTVWIRFRKRPPEFTSIEWESATAYTAGERVYLAATGECYLALESTTNNNPATVPAKWEKIGFPAVLANAVQLFAYADALEDDGQHDKARDKRENAEEQLALEWSKAESQQGQFRTATVLVRSAPRASSRLMCSY